MYKYTGMEIEETMARTTIVVDTGVRDKLKQYRRQRGDLRRHYRKVNEVLRLGQKGPL